MLPESGGTLWSDNMMVPITSPHRRNAERLMDYYYEPEVAAQVAAYVNYVCPVQGAQAEMEKIDPDLAESPCIFPTRRVPGQERPRSFRALDRRRGQPVRRAMWSAKVMGNLTADEPGRMPGGRESGRRPDRLEAGHQVVRPASRRSTT